MKVLLPCLLLSFCFVLSQTKLAENRLPYECSLPKESGKRCRSSQQKWYFDVKRGQCSPFTYYGCRGNPNNFRSRKECRRKCSCRAEINQGIYCNEEYVIRYYWQTSSKLCRKFWFSGCQGNENRYRTIRQCKRVCD